jgi:hypothetical protein
MDTDKNYIDILPRKSSDTDKNCIDIPSPPKTSDTSSSSPYNSPNLSTVPPLPIPRSESQNHSIRSESQNHSIRIPRSESQNHIIRIPRSESQNHRIRKNNTFTIVNNSHISDKFTTGSGS